jgi:hypothetical protein
MLGLSESETKELKDQQYQYNLRQSQILQENYQCNCRNIGKNGMACDDTLYFCEKCEKSDELNNFEKNGAQQDVNSDYVKMCCGIDENELGKI